MKRLVFVVALIVTLTVRAGWTEETDTAKLLAGVGEKLSGYKSWSADYTQVMDMMGQKMTINGRITYRLPHEMRMEMEMPMMGQKGSAVIVMGKDRVMWQDMNMAGQRRVLKMDMNKAPSPAGAAAVPGADPTKDLDPREQIEQMRKNFDLTVLPSQDLHGQSMLVLEGTFKEGLTNSQQAAMAQMFSKMRMYIGKDDAFVHKTEMFAKTGNAIAMSQEFKNVKFNEELPATLFTYKPPEGVQIVDMTEMMKQMQGAGAPPPPPPPPPAAPATPSSAPPPPAE